MAAHARGAVTLAEGDAQAALTVLRQACRTWQQFEAPYHVAQARRLIGFACRAIGDEDAAALELDAARAAFVELGAGPDLAGFDPREADLAGGLTGRELVVLRLLAGGATNRAIAEQLVVSERTVHRHVSNIFAKLGVSSRAAATAHAFRRGLV